MFAAVVYDAVRIGSVRDVPAGGLVLETRARRAVRRATRGIVVASHDDARASARSSSIRSIGIRSVPEEDVHPLPAFAAACLTSGAVTGFVIVDEAPMLLVDLPTLVRERSGAAAA